MPTNKPDVLRAVRVRERSHVRALVFRVLAAVSAGIVAAIIGEALHLPWWRWDVIVSDRATLVTFAVLGVIFITHRE